jgi:hypothetical protein
MNDTTYCITYDCKLKEDCERFREFELGSFKSYAAFNSYTVDGAVYCDHFIEKKLIG